MVIQLHATLFRSCVFTVDKVSDFVDSFLYKLFGSTALACSLGQVLFPQESAQITANFICK